MVKVGKIKWIDYYWERPKTSRYLVRYDNSGLVRLEEYSQDSSSFKVLKFFDKNALDKHQYKSTLVVCRKTIKSSETIWVEKPLWLWLRDNPLG